MIEQITMFKCGICHEVFNRESDAYHCEFIHAREAYANALLQEGMPLSTINYFCGFGWNLTEQQKAITKDSCFIMSHWQCCNKPAYTITHISGAGNIKLWGCGSWSGGYGEEIPLSKLPEPHPKEELFIDKRYLNTKENDND